MKRNLRRSKACIIHRAMKEEPTIVKPCKTSVWELRPKSKVTVPNKKLNLDVDGFICVSYKKRRLSTKFIFNAKCGSYIHILQAKCSPQSGVSKAKRGSRTHALEAKRKSHTHVSEGRRRSYICVSNEKRNPQTHVSAKKLASKTHRLLIPVTPSSSEAQKTHRLLVCFDNL